MNTYIVITETSAKAYQTITGAASASYHEAKSSDPVFILERNERLGVCYTEAWQTTDHSLTPCSLSTVMDYIVNRMFIK